MARVFFYFAVSASEFWMKNINAMPKTVRISMDMTDFFKMRQMH